MSSRKNIENAIIRLSIPVLINQERTTAERRRGEYIQYMSINEFNDWIRTYYRQREYNMTVPGDHLLSFLNEMIKFIDLLKKELKNLEEHDEQILLNQQIESETVKLIEQNIVKPKVDRTVSDQEMYEIKRELMASDAQRRELAKILNLNENDDQNAPQDDEEIPEMI